MSLSNSMTAKLLIEIPKRMPGVRVWRQNTGMGVPMTQVRKAIEFLRHGNMEAAISALCYANRFGIVGGADISGVLPPHGRRLELEVKADRDKQSEEQKAFQSMCVDTGACYLVCRSVDVTLEELAVIYRGEGN